MSSPESIRDRIRRLKEAGGWSQYRLARESGVQQAAISRYLAGKSDVGTETADRLLAVMNPIPDTTPREENRRLQARNRGE